MDRFDLARLTDFDFEKVCKDVFESALGVPLEIFAAGADGGVDLRHVTASGDLIVVQCKHWHRSGRAKLVKHLTEKESLKVQKLRPSRYLVATSVDLTVKSKDKILDGIRPYVRGPGDIWGAGEIEAYLETHPEIVRRNIRLWLSSATVLQSMFANDIITRSEGLEFAIDEALLRYAPSGAHSVSQEMLETYRNCVISGLPGIGKTTLAQVLASQCMSEGYELVEISRDVDEAFKVWSPTAKQVFYYDDFLGQTSLRDSVATNEDSRLVRLMSMVARSDNKYFILTTREYILAQAQQASEQLGRETALLRKCLLDLASYSRLTRAEVLYNHVYFSDLPASNRSIFGEARVYEKIIAHPNFNPRIIALTVSQSVDVEGPEQTGERVLRNLDDPREVWQHMFDNQLSNDEIALVELLFLSFQSIASGDLVKLWSARVGPTGDRSGRAYTAILRRLEGTLIRVDTHPKGSFVRLHNPSVRDYMRGRLGGDSLHLLEVLRGITDIEQLETLFTMALGREGASLLAALAANVGKVERIAVSVLGEDDPSTWSSEWASRTARYVRVSSELGSVAIARAVSGNLTDKRPEVLSDYSDLGNLFEAIRESPHAHIRAVEGDLLEWVIEDVTSDTSLWSLTYTAAETLREIGGLRASSVAESLEADLYDMALEFAREFYETGGVPDGEIVSEVIETLDGYNFVGEDEAARSALVSFEDHRTSGGGDVFRRVPRAVDGAGPDVESTVAAMMASLRPL